MRSFDLTIKNYRCFEMQHPVRLDMRPGIMSFVGTNNSGKSTLLRFFYEMRPLFANLGDEAKGIGRDPAIAITV
jgi:recombinational DNA repair ATPase RecF